MAKNTGNIPTLLPYLESGPGRFSLRLFADRQDSSSVAASAAPFAVDDSDPISRVLGARIVTDAGSELKPVWLRIQRDVYDCATGPLQTLTNPQVEQCWQRAFSARRAEEDTQGSFFFLADQVGEQGDLLPFSSLFCCRAKQVFFDPPCPSCSRPLQLCRDDVLLADRDLEPYSTSLRRYLYCPACAGADSEPPLYVFTRNSSDGAAVHDQRQLIMAWGQLPPDMRRETRFPCPECPGHEACYGRNSLVLENISSVSFYPFYMFISATGDVNGFDFLALLAGARPQELILRHRQAGQRLGISRLNSLDIHGKERGFLYPASDPRHFYEVLFLKLSFLQGLASDLLDGMGTAQYPDISLSLATVSVRVYPGGLLPFFWNFHLRRDGIGQYLAETVPLPGEPPFYTLYALGFLWLSALLVNAGQNVSVLYEIMNRHLRADSGKDDEDLPSLLLEKYQQVFAPAQLFWNKEQVAVDSHGLEVWRRVLTQGLNLLQSGFQGSRISEDILLRQIADLRQEVKNHLLPAAATSAVQPAAKPVQDHNREIHAILTRIGEKWRAAEKVAAGGDRRQEQTSAFTAADTGKEPAGHEELPDLEETVILSPASPAGRAGTTRPDSLLSRISLSREKSEADTLAETIILRPDEKRKKP